MANGFPENGAPETIVEMGRLGNLSDGVFAIALTLLILDIRIPDNVLAADLPASLLALAPRLLVYLISFIVIGGAWGSHQRMIGQIRRGDGLLIWFNLLSLLFVTLIPASATLLGRYPQTLIALVCFAMNVILIQLSTLWLWRHASTSHLINPALDSRVVIGISRRLMLSAAAFALSVPLALLNSVLVYVVWIGLFVLVFTTDWLSWQQAAKTMNVAVPLDNAARGEISVVHRLGHLGMIAGASPDQLVEGVFGGGVDLQSAREGDTLKTLLRALPMRGLMRLRYPWAWNAVIALDWDVKLNAQTPLKLKIDMSVGDSSLDFRDLQLEDLNLQISTASADLWMPTNVGQTNVVIRGNTANAVIRIPANVAARIRASQSLSGLEADMTRFLMIDKSREYRSPDYDSAANKIDIQIEISMGSAKIV